MSKENQLGEYNADGSVKHEPARYYGGRPFTGGGVRMRIKGTPYFYRLQPGAIITEDQRAAIENELMGVDEPSAPEMEIEPEQEIDNGS